MSNPTPPNKLASLARPTLKQPSSLTPSGSVDPRWAEALLLQHPRLSAAAPMVLWQKAALFAVVIVVAAALWTDSEITAAVVMTLLTPAFLCVSVLRTFAVHEVLNAPLRSSPAPPPAEPDVDWPVYSILLPLYREAHTAASIVAALERLKWPAEKRDIIFITEADDTATRFALQTEIHGRA